MAVLLENTKPGNQLPPPESLAAPASSGKRGYRLAGRKLVVELAVHIVNRPPKDQRAGKPIDGSLGRRPGVGGKSQQSPACFWR